MRVCVVGCGAIGSIFAAHLARLEDVEVFAFDLNEEHVKAINERGLRISGAEDFTARLRADTDPRRIPRCDYGLVVTKSTQTLEAIRAAAPIFSDQSVVCSVQNGAGNEEILAEHVHWVAIGTTFPAGHLIGPGHACYDIAGDTWIGPYQPSGTPMRRVEELAQTLTLAGMKTLALEDARGAQWTKLIFNASTNGVGALTLLHHHAATFFEPTGQLFNDLIDEGLAIAQALGIELDGDPKAMVRKASRAPGKHKASMLQDVLAKRPTEVDFMNGAIVRWGEKLDIPTPLNRTVWALVKGLEHSWTDP